jgi:hypothetical protein
MKFSCKIYVLLFVVFVGSIALAYLFPPGTLARQLATIPGGLSLIGVLYQLIRDEAKYQKDLLIQKDQQQFDLGITSHMANVAFDKHVEFCEEYLSAMHEAIKVLYREGHSRILIDQANILSAIKQKHIAWLTPAIEQGLDPFEQALREIGASAWHYAADPEGANASGSVQKAHNLLCAIIGHKKTAKIPPEENIAIPIVLSHLRKVLGIEELTIIRQKLLKCSPDYSL